VPYQVKSKSYFIKKTQSFALPHIALVRDYVVWQKSNETGILLTTNFILCTNQGYPPQNSFLGQLHSDGGVFSIVRSSAGRLLLEYFQLVGYAFLDIIQSTKMAPFQVVFEPGE